MTVVDAKRVATGEMVNNREASLRCFLPTEHGAKVCVCKPMFLSTLGWRSDNTVMEFVKAKISSNIATVISPTLNRRGKHKR